MIQVPEHIKFRAWECAFFLAGSPKLTAEYDEFVNKLLKNWDVSWEDAQKIFRLYNEIVERRV